jgi:signal transduction histidine kinase
MICKEAFANVVKYSRAQKATLDISLENNFLSIIITDNGVGFELPRVLSGTRNGIKNIIQRVKSYKKATIQIDTGLDQGTTIKIKLPVKNGTNML